MKKFEEAVNEFEKIWKKKHPRGFLAFYINAEYYSDGTREYECRVSAFTGKEETDEDIKKALNMYTSGKTYDEAETELIEKLNKYKEEIND